MSCQEGQKAVKMGIGQWLRHLETCKICGGKHDNKNADNRGTDRVPQEADKETQRCDKMEHKADKESL